MGVLYRADGFVSRHMPPVVLICVALGIAFPEVFSQINLVSIPLFAFMTFANSLGGGFREMWEVARRPLPVLVILGLLHVVMPLVSLGLGTLLLFPQAPLFTTGLVLEYAIPTGVATLMWVSMCRGNTSLCLSVVLLDTLLSPLVVPLTMRLLVGSVVEMDTWGMMKDLMLMVALPALAAMILYQSTGGAVAHTLKPRLALRQAGAAADHHRQCHRLRPFPAKPDPHPGPGDGGGILSVSAGILSGLLGGQAAGHGFSHH